MGGMSSILMVVKGREHVCVKLIHKLLITQRVQTIRHVNPENLKGNPQFWAAFFQKGVKSIALMPQFTLKNDRTLIVLLCVYILCPIPNLRSPSYSVVVSSRWLILMFVPEFNYTRECAW